MSSFRLQIVKITKEWIDNMTIAGHLTAHLRSKNCPLLFTVGVSEKRTVKRYPLKPHKIRDAPSGLARGHKFVPRTSNGPIDGPKTMIMKEHSQLTRRGSRERTIIASISMASLHAASESDYWQDGETKEENDGQQ
ncbi:hypothetical protein AVEN_160335-1 [Araneus ventricosus]|uniref:Uncharacterized protein n=1 Tax=Araneus ventricosus TaxID=182803 RepID=A0A4Y2TMZ7_ARAVE|nr:hypothetical protein AVEN_160335-1 [Araneus ventricosus]